MAASGLQPSDPLIRSAPPPVTLQYQVLPEVSHPSLLLPLMGLTGRWWCMTSEDMWMNEPLEKVMDAFRLDGRVARRKDSLDKETFHGLIPWFREVRCWSFQAKGLSIRTTDPNLFRSCSTEAWSLKVPRIALCKHFSLCTLTVSVWLICTLYLFKLPLFALADSSC